MSELDQLRPSARRDGLLTRDVDGELVVYDTKAEASHLLSGVAASVWRLCDGGTTVAAISEAAAGSDLAMTHAALEGLDDAGLIDGYHVHGMSRRRMLRTLGAAVIAIPLVTTLAAEPAAAQTVCNPGCGPLGACTRASGTRTCGCVNNPAGSGQICTTTN